MGKLWPACPGCNAGSRWRMCRGLLRWEEVFGNNFVSVFIFAYDLANIDTDTDGKEIFEFNGKRYLFLCLKLSDYRNLMKTRSPRWQTVMLGAEDFRRNAIDLKALLLNYE